MKIENTTYQNLQDTAKAVHRGKFTEVSTYLKEKRLIFCLSIIIQYGFLKKFLNSQQF